MHGRAPDGVEAPGARPGAGAGGATAAQARAGIGQPAAASGWRSRCQESRTARPAPLAAQMGHRAGIRRRRGTALEPDGRYTISSANARRCPLRRIGGRPWMEQGKEAPRWHSVPIPVSSRARSPPSTASTKACAAHAARLQLHEAGPGAHRHRRVRRRRPRPALYMPIFGTPLKWVVMLAPLASCSSSRPHPDDGASTAQMTFWAFCAVMGLSMAASSWCSPARASPGCSSSPPACSARSASTATRPRAISPGWARSCSWA